MANAEITVTVERAAHDGLTEFCQRMFDQHGIQIQGMTVVWMDIGSIAEPRSIVHSLRIISQTAGDFRAKP